MIDERTSRTARQVIAEMDRLVDELNSTSRFINEPLTKGRARMFVLQHRLNTRQRNSVLKLRVATNIPDWDLKLRVIQASTEEIIADNQYGQGRPHWAILEDLGRAIGLTTEEMRAATPIESTQIAWLCWEALMSNRHWLEGLVANTCAERGNLPGYGQGIMREIGFAARERQRWAALFGLPEQQVEFWSLHSEADVAHSNMGWNAVAEHAVELHMEDRAVEACRLNLMVWKRYFDGIAEAGDNLQP